jgi:hypothetical protein
MYCNGINFFLNLLSIADIFQTPDFYRAAKDIEKNERLCQRAPDLLCQEGRYKQARKWYQDEQLCGFRKTDG